MIDFIGTVVMTAGLTAGGVVVIVILVLILAIMGIGYYAYRRIRKKVREFSLAVLGTANILKGLQNVDKESEITPKSVSAATSIYLPNIMRDFPDFHYDEMKRRAENVLTSYLRSVEEQNDAKLTEGTNELKSKLKLRIDMLKDASRREYFQNIKIHRTEICNYRKAKGRCSVVFQTSVQYNYWLEQDGKVTDGARDKLRQSKYNVEMIYIQDRDIVENLEDAGIAMNCPNCGAPLPKLGAKKCAYCDSPVMEFSIRTWNFSDVQEVR